MRRAGSGNREAERVAGGVEAYFKSSTPTGVVSAYLFGSHARGAAHRESDVDVGVVFDRGAVPARVGRARAAARLGTDLIAATHRNAVDVVVLNEAPPELVGAAVSGRRVYCADPAGEARGARAVTFLVERLADLGEHLRHLWTASRRRWWTSWSRCPGFGRCSCTSTWRFADFPLEHLT